MCRIGNKSVFQLRALNCLPKSQMAPGGPRGSRG